MAAMTPLPQPDLAAAVWDVVGQIPAGAVASYGQIAAALGDKGAARYVASLLLHHEPREVPCPCFRVIRASGEVGQYAHGSTEGKAVALRAESHRVCDGMLEDPRYLSLPQQCELPFESMRRWQDRIANETCPGVSEIPSEIAGLDVSYGKDGKATAACAVVEVNPSPRKAARVIWSTTKVVAVDVPYVSGYLVFRELPALLAVYEEACRQGQWPGLAMIDGSGRLHPRRAGVATCFSILTGQPSIGVTKKRLMGNFSQPTFSEPQAVVVDERRVGTAMRGRTGGKPVFVSPGSGISQRQADEIVRGLMTIHRVPEPIYWADRLSREAAKRGQ